MDKGMENEIEDISKGIMGLGFLFKMITRSEIVYLSEDALEYLAYAVSAQMIDTVNKFKPLFTPPDNLEGVAE